MKWLNLKVVEDSTTGMNGVILEDMKPMATFVSVMSDGMGVAHDVVEHVNGPRAIGSIHDELEAFGAMWFTRGWTGVLNPYGHGSYYSAEENMAHDISNMAVMVALGVNLRAKIPHTHVSEYDEAFVAIVAHAKKLAREELNDRIAGENRSLANRRECLARMQNYFDACIPFFRVGYRKAKRRFGDRDVAYEQFMAILEAADKVIPFKHLEVGDRFRLGWGAGEARVISYYDEYEGMY